ncbi:MAG TPA: TIGR02391 family protein [Pyrinomonadaceae bacterium]|nr:TIGR02391 family protein [Pyrinomonadaceae bacterium]
MKFNSLSNLADQNEQTGLSLIAQGIATGLRNPKGHQPKAAIQLGPYEALEQLAVISYLMKRLDAATK